MIINSLQMKPVDEVQSLIQPVLQRHDAFLVDLVLRSERGGQVVEVFIDTDHGVTTDLCAEVSRDLSALLDRTEVIPRKYVLVVSSPGLDRPLKFPRQYRRNIGRRLRVTHRAEQGVRTIEGELADSTEAGIMLRMTDGNDLSLEFAEIVEAKVCLPW